MLGVSIITGRQVASAVCRNMADIREIISAESALLLNDEICFDTRNTSLVKVVEHLDHLCQNQLKGQP